MEGLGWLLSFYAGQRIHPIAWEGESARGLTWCIRNIQPVTPLGGNYVGSCLQDVPLQRFLQDAWKAWQNHDAKWRARLKGATNAYNDILSATFVTQRLALTAMYLERFRSLVLGNSTVLDAVNKERRKEKKERIDESEMAQELSGTLIDYIRSIDDLAEQERDALIKPVNNIASGHVTGLFRESLKRSLIELYERADLNIDQDKLGKFITERNKVIHGYWDSGRRGSLKTFELAEYGLNLLEILTLRLFQYEGDYYNRVSRELENYPPGTTTW